MSRFLILTIAGFVLLSLAGGAQATDFFGGASPLPMWLTADYADLNPSLEHIGVSTLDNGAFLMGWSFYLYVHPSVRVGLMGAGGSKLADGMDDIITREVKVGLGFLGATGEYVFSFMRGDVAVGTMLGWGHADIELWQIQSDPIDWDLIWDSYVQEPALPGNFGTTLKGNFFAYQPFLRLKYKLTGWLSLQGSVGYLGAEVSSWKQRGDVGIDNEPTLDFGGAMFTLGPHIGF
jgi:hypothetical protein